MIRWSALALAIAIALPGQAAAQATEPFVASDIRVDGLQRISEGTVFSYLPIERGDRVDRESAARAIRALFETGFFNDVKLERQGNILVVVVAERPAINKLTLIGNKDVKEEDLRKGLTEIGLAEGETFDRANLERVTQELERQYNNRGKYNVAIEPIVTDLDRNRVDITIAIREGKAAKIRHINVVGNESYPDKEILDNWESDTSNWLSWYSRGDQYSRQKLSGDLERLDSFYLDRGYVDFAVESTQVSISPDKRDIYVTANVREGEIFNVGDVRVTGDTIIPQAEIEKLVLTQKGMRFSRRLIDATAETMSAVLANVGYAFAEVEPIPTVDRDNKTVALNYFVEPGPRVQVRRIVFKGNTRTSDEVLRREMRQFEGSWYSQAALDRSKIRIQRLGFFDKVDIETPQVAGTADVVDVEINVEERSSGSFIFGLGFSQLSGLITSVSVQQSNFFGTGNKVAFTVQNNDFSRRLDFSYLDPYFTDDGLSVGYNIYYRELDQGRANTASYTTDNGAFQTVFGLPLTETDTVGLTLGIDYNTISTFPGVTPDSIIDYINALNQRTFHAWRSELSWARDTRNAFFNPTSGAYQRVAAEVTLPGSTVEYYKLFYQYGRFWPLNRHLVLLTAGELGYGDNYDDPRSRVIQVPDGDDEDDLPDDRLIIADGLPFFENFYAGGVRSIRGFEDNSLGPVFVNPNFARSRQPLGGALKTVGSVEAYFPTLLDTDAARVSAFFDFGNVFADVDAFSVSDFRASVGLSLEWQAPIGAIVISFAQPLIKEDGDEVERIQFTFGGRF